VHVFSCIHQVVRTHLFPDDATGAVVITAAATAAAADVLAVGTVTGVVYLFDRWAIHFTVMKNLSRAALVSSGIFRCVRWL
jgi:hypothetical protein